MPPPTLAGKSDKSREDGFRMPAAFKALEKQRVINSMDESIPNGFRDEVMQKQKIAGNIDSVKSRNGQGSERSKRSQESKRMSKKSEESKRNSKRSEESKASEEEEDRNKRGQDSEGDEENEIEGESEGDEENEIEGESERDQENEIEGESERDQENKIDGESEIDEESEKDKERKSSKAMAENKTKHQKSQKGKQSDKSKQINYQDGDDGWTLAKPLSPSPMDELGKPGNTPDLSLQQSTGVDLSVEQSRHSCSLVRSSIELGVNANQTRDRYGFKKNSNFISEESYNNWWNKYRKYALRRKRKWIRFMKENGLYTKDDQPIRFPPNSEKLKRYIRKGIPAEWRGNAWFWYAKGYEKLNAHPGLYDKLFKQTANLKNNDTELIERDLHRTFPDNIYFRQEGSNQSNVPPSEETPLIQALRRVLTSFSVYQPKIGYCQSLNFIAGVLLLFMDEEKAFWMLVIITQRYLPGIHEVNLEGVNVDQGVLMLCVKQRLPDMWKRLGVNFEGNHYENILSKLPPITLCTASWFMSAFISILPTETMLRVWDCVFYEDSKIFFRVSLTILKMAEPELKSITDQMELFQAIQNFPKKMLDPDDLMEHCFKRRNGFGHISQEEIQRLRKFVTERRRLAKVLEVSDISHHNGVSSTENVHLQTANGNPTTTDIDEFNKLQPVSKGLSIKLTKRIRSLKVGKEVDEYAQANLMGSEVRDIRSVKSQNVKRMNRVAHRVASLNQLRSDLG